jgi:multidrug efflux pump subunit AcrA (membrane-fusion protein)
VKDINDIQLRSEEVQEILTKVPHWMVRWGTVLIFAILLMLLFVSWFIKYPDIVSAPIVITTNVPPQKLIAKTTGRIDTIFVTDKTVVSKNMPLAIIENTANYKDVFSLTLTLSKGEGIDDSNLRYKLEIKDSANYFDFKQFENAQFGEIETAFANFKTAYITDSLNRKLQPFKVQGVAQSSEMIQIKERINLLESQKSISQSELALQKLDLERYKTLYSKGIIATQELEKHKLTYLQVDKSFKSLLSSISSLKSSLIDAEKNSQTNAINENKESTNLQNSKKKGALLQLKKAIKDWELNFVLRSSIAGKVNSMQIWTANQTVNAGDNVFTIIPINGKGFIVKLKAPAPNSGKIKVGQTVNIRLSNFPDREFGMLVGKIKNISLTPDKEGNLLMDVDLPNKLITTYKKTIPFQQEMSGTAGIVTEDLRLMERLLYQFRDVFKR